MAFGDDDIAQPLPGWESVLTGRPPLELALTRAVLIAHRMMDFEVQTPAGKARVAAAWEAVYNSRQGVTLGLAEIMGGPRPDPAALHLHAVNQFLLLTMGTGEPLDEALVNEALDCAIEAARNDPYYVPMVAVEMLLAAEHLAEAGDLVHCRLAVERATEVLVALDRRRYPSAEPALTAARAAFSLLEVAPSQPAASAPGTAPSETPTSAIEPPTDDPVRALELEALEYGDRAEELHRSRRDLPLARHYSDLAIAAIEELRTLVTRDVDQHSLAATLYYRAAILTDLGEPELAVVDADRAIELYASLAGHDPGTYEPLIVDVRGRRARALAAVEGSSDGERRAARVRALGEAETAVFVERGLYESGRSQWSDLARLLCQQAAVLRQVDSPDAARRVEQEALDLYRQHLSELTVSDAHYLAEAALAHAASQLAEGQVSEARATIALAEVAFTRLRRPVPPVVSSFAAEVRSS